MATLSPKPKRKMMDIRRKPSSASASSVQVKKPEAPTPKRIEDDLKNLCKEVEQFEKKEEKVFQKEEKVKKEKRFKLKRRSKIIFAVFGLALLFIIGGFYLADRFLARADVKIITKKTEWDYVDAVSVSKNISNFDTAKKQIPGEVFSSVKNYTFSFPASGKKSVQDKATGKITIYNAYSSDSQVLAATTRFSTPDNKIFRLTEKVIVPGAQIVGGKIIPSSIETSVMADQAGTDYNIGPISHFSVPGFQGTAKYSGFYASSNQAMAGGFIGARPFPTDNDIKQDEQKAEADFRTFIDSALALQLPSDFKFIDGAKQFTISKEQVNNQVDDKGNFTIFLEGKSSAIGFKEGDLKNLMEAIGQNTLGQTFKIKSYQADYGAGRTDFNQGQISFAFNFKGIFEEPLDVNDFSQKISGKTADGIKNIISSFPNIDKAAVSFWPFWVSKVPGDLSKVKVDVE